NASRRGDQQWLLLWVRCPLAGENRAGQGRRQRTYRKVRARPRTPACDGMQPRQRVPLLAGVTTNTAEELRVGHALPSFRLHLERDERTVVEPRAPDEHAAALERRPGADVRRERAYPAPGVDRVVEVELAVGRADLLGVRHAFLGLLGETRRRQDVPEEPRGDLGGPREDRARVVFVADRKGLLRRDRACVERLDGAVDRDAGLLVAPEDGALDGRGAAPARQQRRMNVEPEGLLEEARRDVQAVRADDDGVDRLGELGPLGLVHRDAEPLGGDLRRRRRERAAAAAGRVGPRYEI